MYTQKKDNVSVLLSLKKLPVKIEMIDLPNQFENPLYLCVEKKKSLEKTPEMFESLS